MEVIRPVNRKLNLDSPPSVFRRPSAQNRSIKCADRNAIIVQSVRLSSPAYYHTCVCARNKLRKFKSDATREICHYCRSLYRNLYIKRRKLSVSPNARDMRISLRIRSLPPLPASTCHDDLSSITELSNPVYPGFASEQLSVSALKYNLSFLPDTRLFRTFERVFVNALISRTWKIDFCFSSVS